MANSEQRNPWEENRIRKDIVYVDKKKKTNFSSVFVISSQSRLICIGSDLFFWDTAAGFTASFAEEHCHQVADALKTGHKRLAGCRVFILILSSEKRLWLENVLCFLQQQIHLLMYFF